jgi:hypothetical protein
LHGVEADFSLPPDLEHRNDIGMVQPSRSLGLATEALLGLSIADHMAGQDFQGHAAAE